MRLIYAFLFLLLSPCVMAKPLVVTTFSILEDMVHEIAQDKVEVRTLVGPNQDAHVFEPRPQNAKDIANADLVIVNGLGFEGWLSRLIEASGYQGPIVIVTEGVNPLMVKDNGDKRVDPHAWHSLDNALVYIDNIVKGLSVLRPQDAAYFQKRGKDFKARIRTLEKDIQGKMAEVPSNKRKVITNHDAFGYLGREFNITFFSPLGISTEAEPSAKSVAKLIEKIRREKINAVFVENISNPRLLTQITEETGTHIGGVLYSDALSNPGTEADTYLKMMEFNLMSLVEAIKRN